MADTAAMQRQSILISRPASPAHQHTVVGRTLTGESGLPPHDEVQSILQDFFCITARFFPFIDREDFMATYSSLRKGNSINVRKSWLGLLNVILALATSTSHNSSHSARTRSEQAEIFYNHSLRLCDRNVTRTTSLEVGKYTNSAKVLYADYE